MKSYRVREKLHENLLEHLLLARGVEPTEHDAFLTPEFERDSHDPFLLPDMDKAVERLQLAKKNGEHVAVWSDYDCDGIPGGVLLASFLREWGLRITHYIPHRHKEGYGLNIEGIEELKAAGVSVIITVDLGTTEVAQIAHALTLGIDTIVTDHHLVPTLEHLPKALALLNPKRPDSKYPFDGLCGAGVAWKLVQAILVVDRPAEYKEGQEKWLVDLVGLATLSDMVPLVGENRMLARNGLVVMRRGRRPGLAALLKLLRISPETLTEDDVTFMVSPRINAASRMDSPQIAAALLAATDPEEAKRLAAQLNRINDERKGLVAATVKEVNKRIEGQDLTLSPLIVMGNPNWRPGILGLVANNLMEAHGKTVFLWGREGGDVIRGSCRSDGSVNIVELMGATREIFGHFGGHAASGGFSLAEESVHELSQRLNAAYTAAAGERVKEEILIDRELDLSELSHALRDLQKLAPFGIGNTKPLFLFPGVSVASARMFGKTQNHLEVTLLRGSARATGIAFFCTPDSFTKKSLEGEKVDVVGHVELDWRGAPRIRVVDVL
jgi:single-stranded-DNA-specific exonuclease